MIIWPSRGLPAHAAPGRGTRAVVPRTRTVRGVLTSRLSARALAGVAAAVDRGTAPMSDPALGNVMGGALKLKGGGIK
jgi:hypothetical protein